MNRAHTQTSKTGTNAIQNATSTTVSKISTLNTNITETVFAMELENTIIELPGRISEWTTQIEIIQDNIYTSLEDYNLMSYFEALQLSYVVLHIHRITWTTSRQTQVHAGERWREFS